MMSDSRHVWLSLKEQYSGFDFGRVDIAGSLAQHLCS